MSFPICNYNSASELNWDLYGVTFMADGCGCGGGKKK